MTKRTLAEHPEKENVSGFRVRMRSHTGRRVIKAGDKKVEKE